MRAVDDHWPQVGSRIHHSAGVWPAVINDDTEVLGCEPLRRLVLREGVVQARGERMAMEVEGQRVRHSRLNQ